MTADIITVPKFQRVRQDDHDAKVAKAISDFLSGFLSALNAADTGLTLIEIEKLRPSTAHMVQRFSEHLDDMQNLVEEMTITRNLARFAAHVAERNGK